MALLNVDTSFNFKPLQNLLHFFPDISGQLLALIGGKARGILRRDYFSGQEITLKPGPKDKKGKFMIRSDVNKSRTSTKIYSYPINLFEKGRLLRDGSKEPGKFVITKKLKGNITAGMGGYLNEFERSTLADGLKRAGL